VTEPKIETIDDARQLAIQFIRDEAAAAPGARVLVFGLWDGPEEHVRKALALPEGVEVDIALHRKRWMDVIERRRTYSLVWVVGFDRFEDIPLPGDMQREFGASTLPGALSLLAVSSTCFDAGARVVGLVREACSFLHGLRWTRMAAQRFDKIKRTYVVATLDERPAEVPKPQEPLA
jgi:hypothetical protein